MLLAEEAAEHAARFFLEGIHCVAFEGTHCVVLEAVEVDVGEEAVGVELGDDVLEVKVLKVETFEGVGYLRDVEAVAEVVSELGDDLLDVHSGVFLVNDYYYRFLNA